MIALLYWWDDAVARANEAAAVTGIRHRVTRATNGWRVGPVEAVS